MIKKVLVSLLPLSLVCAQTFFLKPGWNLVGAAQDIQNLSSFDKAGCIEAMWKYDPSLPKQWSVHLPSSKFTIPDSIGTFDFIKYGEGVWIYNKSSQQCIIDSKMSTSSTSSSIANGTVLQTASGHKILGATVVCNDNGKTFTDNYNGKNDGVYPAELKNCTSINILSGFVDDGDGVLNPVKDTAIDPIKTTNLALSDGKLDANDTVLENTQVQQAQKILENIEQAAEQNATAPVEETTIKEVEQSGAQLVAAAASLLNPEIGGVVIQVQTLYDAITLLESAFPEFGLRTKLAALAEELENAHTYEDLKKFLQDLQDFLADIAQAAASSSSSSESSSSSAPASSSSSSVPASSSSSSVPASSSSSSVPTSSSSSVSSSSSSSAPQYDTVIELTQGNTSQTVADLTLEGLAGEKLAFNKKDNLSGTLTTFIIKVDGEVVAAVTVPNDMTGEFEFTDANGNTYEYTFEDAISEGNVNFIQYQDSEASSSSVPASSSSSTSSESIGQGAGTGKF